MTWTDGQKLEALGAVWEDKKKGFSANFEVLCPICQTQSLQYQYENLFDGTVWCHNCNSGFKQGNGHKVPATPCGEGI